MKNQKTVQMALLVSAASVLFTVETLIPNPLPFVRLGLANIASLLALRWWGLKEAILVLILRILVGSLLTGKFLNPIFVLALAGGLSATLGMAILMKWEKRYFSLIGVSLFGAFCKNLTQLILASLVLIRSIYIFRLLPLFLGSALLGGLIIGYFSFLIDKRFSPLLEEKRSP